MLLNSQFFNWIGLDKKKARFTLSTLLRTTIESLMALNSPSWSRNLAQGQNWKKRTNLLWYTRNQLDRLEPFLKSGSFVFKNSTTLEPTFRKIENLDNEIVCTHFEEEKAFSSGKAKSVAPLVCHACQAFRLSASLKVVPNVPLWR